MLDASAILDACKDLLHEIGSKKNVFCTTSRTTASDDLILIANIGVASASLASGHAYAFANMMVLPRKFYIQLDLITATSWSGSLSFQFTQ